jgi:hypothetical protein
MFDAQHAQTIDGVGLGAHPVIGHHVENPLIESDFYV